MLGKGHKHTSLLQLTINIDASLTLCNKALDYLEIEIKFLYIDHGER